MQPRPLSTICMHMSYRRCFCAPVVVASLLMQYSGRSFVAGGWIRLSPWLWCDAEADSHDTGSGYRRCDRWTYRCRVVFVSTKYTWINSRPIVGPSLCTTGDFLGRATVLAQEASFLLLAVNSGRLGNEISSLYELVTGSADSRARQINSLADDIV